MTLPTNLTDALRYQRGTQRGDEVWKELAAKEIAELKERLDAIAPKTKAVEPEPVAEPEPKAEPVLSTTVDISTVEPSA